MTGDRGCPLGARNGHTSDAKTLGQNQSISRGLYHRSHGWHGWLRDRLRLALTAGRRWRWHAYEYGNSHRSQIPVLGKEARVEPVLPCRESVKKKVPVLSRRTGRRRKPRSRRRFLNAFLRVSF